MKSAEEDNACSLSWTHASDPVVSRHCEDEQTNTDEGTSNSVGYVSFVDEQDAEFKMSLIKEEPGEENYLCGEPLSSVGQIIHNPEFLKNPIIKEEDSEDAEYLVDPIKEEDSEDAEYLMDLIKEEELGDTEYLMDPIKEEDLEDKDYLYCENCKAFFINKCEVHGPALFIRDTPVPLGVTDRARQTLPPGLAIRESSIPRAGLGVFNEGETVPVGAHFGPYQGELVDREEAMNSRYSWVIFKNRMYEEYIDAKRELHANWMRYVNCARIDEEQNLVAFQYRGGILYRCCRPINPGQELLVWYEEEYAKDLSVVFDYLWNKKCSLNEMNNTLLHVSACSLCPLSYTSQKSLHRHMTRCHNEQHVKLTEPMTLSNLTPTVSFSDQQTSSGSLLTSTSQQQMQKELHNCLDCGKSFPHQSALKQHQLIHAGQKPYQCSQCGKRFNTKCKLQIHERIHTGEKPYQCSQCGKSFTEKCNLQTHQRIHTGEKPYQCSHCGKGFTHQSDVKVHQRIHTGEKPYQCSHCAQAFTGKYSLKRHQHVHTGEKPYHCSECRKSFTYSSSLKRHERTCKGEKQYCCSQCGESFTVKRNLLTHQRIHREENLHRCSECGFGFTKERFLQIHQRIHIEVKPYECAHCGECFAEKRMLQTHRRTHIGNHLFHCSQCGMSYIEEYNLRKHELIHTAEQPGQCSHCGEILTHQSEVKLHQRVHQWRLAKAGSWGNDTANV